MTAIVGFTKNKKVYIGGDRIAASDSFSTDVTKSKVFRNGDFLIGYTSSFRFGEILEYCFTPPTPSSHIKNDKHFLVAEFIPALRKCLEDNKYCSTDANGESGSALIGYKSKLYDLQGDWSILEYGDGYAAAGCGMYYSYGCLYGLKDSGLHPKKIVKKALMSAAKYHPLVSAKYDILSI